MAAQNECFQAYKLQTWKRQTIVLFRYSTILLNYVMHQSVVTTAPMGPGIAGIWRGLSICFNLSIVPAVPWIRGALDFIPKLAGVIFN